VRYDKLQWLFPIAVTLHNAEEAIWMPGWATDHAAQLPIASPGSAKIRIALLVLTLTAFLLTYLSARRGPRSVWAYLTFGYIVAVLLNVFVPHVPIAIVVRGYAPGVVTAVLINLPAMSYLAMRAVRDGWVGGKKAVAAAILVPILGAISIAAFFSSGKIISYVF